MKNLKNSLSATKSLAVLFLFFSVMTALNAAPAISLKGATDEVKYASDKDVSLSLVEWSTAEELTRIESAYNQFLNDENLEPFLEALAEQESKGYLFTASATGYAIKYAWNEKTSSAENMYFLITPGLKSRNPYRWKTPNNSAKSFTLMQVALENEKAVAKSSLDGKIVLNSQGNLQLENFSDLSVFANLEDNTPYYLK